MAILSKNIKLSYATSSTGTFTDLNDMLEIPALGGSPEKVDVTCLADSCRHYIKGIIDYGDLQFKFNYVKAQFDALYAACGDDPLFWKVTLPDNTVATFSGEGSVAIEGVGVNAAITYTLSIALDSDIAFA